jgi:hypothetical protein
MKKTRKAGKRRNYKANDATLINVEAANRKFAALNELIKGLCGSMDCIEVRVVTLELQVERLRKAIAVGRKK